MSEKIKYDVAELIIYCDAIEEVLTAYEYKFKHTSKFEFAKIKESTRKILKASFANTEVSDLDNFVYELRQFTQELIKGEIYETC